MYVTHSLRSIVNEIMKQIYVHGVWCHSSRAVRPILIKFFSGQPCFSVELFLLCLQDTIRNDIHKP